MANCLEEGHKWVFKGLVYHYDSQMAGSSARPVIYEDAYFCERCLSQSYMNARTVGDSYMERIKGSVPK